MFTIQNVFEPPEIADLTQDAAVIESYTLLKSFLSGESVPSDAVQRARRHLDPLEPLLIEHFLDEIRADFTAESPGAAFQDGGDILAFAEKMTAARAAALRNLDFFSSGGQRQLQAAWAAMVRSAIDFDLFDARLVAYMRANPLSSAGGLHLVNLLTQLGLGSETWRSVASVLPLEIRVCVTSRFKGAWTRSVVGELHQWLDTEYFPALRIEPAPENPALLRSKLVAIAETCLAELRIEEIFDMIMSFGDSEPGLEDLKLTMTTAHLRNLLITKMDEECPVRLLNNGVTTVDIFLGYLQCIKSFSVLDPRGILLENVSRPIRKYLKGRKDSVSLLVDGLMGQESSPLSFLASGLRHTIKTGQIDLKDKNWVPDPIDTPEDFVQRQITDTISTLLSLFDNKDVIMLQLTEEFAKRLLVTQSREDLALLYHKADDLKRRFGGRQLQNIDVMIQDINRSNSTNEAVHEDAPHLRSVQALVISRLYWPNITDGSSLNLPSRIEQLLGEYRAAYSQVQRGKKISWIPNLGRVSISVELQDRNLDLVVTPDQAVVLGAFEGVEELSLEELLKHTGLPQQNVLIALRFWMEQSVIGSTSDKYHVLEVLAAAEDDTAQVNVIPEPVAESSYKDMEIYWSYIQHMLTNVGPLPVDRIHSFLLMLVPKETPYVKTKEQLEAFLEAMVGEEKLKQVEDRFALE